MKSYYFLARAVTRLTHRILTFEPEPFDHFDNYLRALDKLLALTKEWDEWKCPTCYGSGMMQAFLSGCDGMVECWDCDGTGIIPKKNRKEKQP